MGAFFDLRAAGQTLGLVTDWGAGSWGLLRMLQDAGKKTVPEVAKMRSVSRQYIQKLANELIEAGLIEMVANPGHRRSQFMQLTPGGEQKLAELSQNLRRVLAELEQHFVLEELTLAVKAIAALRQQLSKLD